MEIGLTGIVSGIETALFHVVEELVDRVMSALAADRGLRGRGFRAQDFPSG